VEFWLDFIAEKDKLASQHFTVSYSFFATLELDDEMLGGNFKLYVGRIYFNAKSLF